MLTQEQQIFEQIKKSKNILITFRKTWNGDSVASALAIFLLIKKINQNVEIIAEKPSYDNIFSFLPAYNKIKNSVDNLRKFIISLDTTKATVSQVKYKMEENILNFIISPKDGFFSHDDITSRPNNFKYDLIITVDAPDLESLGRIYEDNTDFFYQAPIINIDHHSSNEEFGQINYTQLTAVSTTEILFSLVNSFSRDLIDEDIATCLLAGIISKTKSFKTYNITPYTLLAASQLISIGGRREEIVNHLYRSRSLNLLKIWGRVLARLSSSLDNKLVWSTLTHSDFIKTDSSVKDLTDVIDELIINIPQANIIVILYEQAASTDKNNSSANKYSVISSSAKFQQDEQANRLAKTEDIASNVLVYSIKNINSLNLIKKFNPQGTKNVAHAVINKPVLEAEKEVINLIKEKLSNLSI